MVLDNTNYLNIANFFGNEVIGNMTLFILVCYALLLFSATKYRFPTLSLELFAIAMTWIAFNYYTNSFTLLMAMLSVIWGGYLLAKVYKQQFQG